MPYTKVYVHVVFGTRRRIPLLEKSVKEIMIKHILSHGREKGICIDTINGTEDHLHLLIRLQSTQTIAKVMHSIKGESAWWCNSNKLTDQKLAWAKGYYSASISPEILSRTRRYIRNQ